MKHKDMLGLGLLCAVSLASYVWYSASSSGLGFPLDDAWIHQTYARNLALRGEWAFVPGQPSAGATSLLWVLLLVPGYWLGLSPIAWTFFLGWLLLIAIATTVLGAARLMLPKERSRAIAIAAILALEWHLVWAAASGMETLLFSWLATLILVRVARLSTHPDPPDIFWLHSGLGVGLACLARPEGLTLLAPLALGLWLHVSPGRERLGALARAATGFAACFLPYLVFNWSLSGGIWPNTFYAKQAEYAELLGQPLFDRLLQQFAVPMVGIGLLLLPGFIRLLLEAFHRRDWALLLAAAWPLGMALMYALRLPVTFQHGRYLIPGIPLYLLLGGVGTFQWLRLQAKPALPRLVSRTWMGAGVLVLLAFFVLGARAYQQDVAFIQEEMVASAGWVRSHTGGTDLIAAHDIGALGYFAERPILDLAGLVSPEVIPFLRDEARLAAYLDMQEADYLVTFPGWYPALADRADRVFETTGSASLELGGENMAVYRWRGVSD